MAGRNPNPVTRSDSAQFHRDSVTVRHPEPPPTLTPEEAAQFRIYIAHFHAADAQDQTIIAQVAIASRLFLEAEKLTDRIITEGALRQGAKGLYQHPAISTRRALVSQINGALKLAGYDSAKRFSTLAERGALSSIRQTDGAPNAASSDSHGESLFASPIMPAAVIKGATESFDDIYKRN